MELWAHRSVGTIICVHSLLVAVVFGVLFIIFFVFVHSVILLQFLCAELKLLVNSYLIWVAKCIFMVLAVVSFYLWNKYKY